MNILVINSGSSSLKVAVFQCNGGGEIELLRGAVEGIGQPMGRLWIQQNNGKRIDRTMASPAPEEALSAIIVLLDSLGIKPPVAISHRVVHGGVLFAEPKRIDAGLLRSLGCLIHLAPLHLPSQIAMIEDSLRHFPGVPQVACFDTAFFRQLPERSQRQPLPSFLWDAGVRRYGFHGLSYESILATHPAAKKGRVIIAHLGNGCSLAALRDGRPLNTSMGFTPTSGLMMSTRSGDLDPNVLIYLIKHLGYTYDELENLVNHESGLKGVSGLRGDMRQLLEVRHQFPAADLAIEMFCDGVRRQIGAYAADLAGLDQLIFTGGIGEGASAVRRSICSGLEHLGVYLADPELPAPGIISSPSSACTVAVVRSDEELMIARHCRKLVPCLQ